VDFFASPILSITVLASGLGCDLGAGMVHLKMVSMCRTKLNRSIHQNPRHRRLQLYWNWEDI
jgi:hypothetical protein